MYMIFCKCITDYCFKLKDDGDIDAKMRPFSDSKVPFVTCTDYWLMVSHKL